MKYNKGTFVVVPNLDILTGQSSGCQAIFMWLCSYTDENGICFPSRRKLSEHLGCTMRTVDRHILELETLGIIKKTSRRKPGDITNKSNLYQLLIPEQGVIKEKQGAVGDNEQVDTDDTVTIPINNYTQVTIESESLPSTEVSSVTENKVIVGQLPINRGSTPIQRLRSIYNQLYLDKYGFLPSLDMLKVGGSIDSMLKTRSEFQIAAMMVVYFNWRGMDGSDDFAEKRLVNASHPFSWLPSSMNTHETYLRNVQRLDFDNNDEVAKFVRDYMIKIKK